MAQVKAHTRKTKSGKGVSVKSYPRKQNWTTRLSEKDRLIFASAKTRAFILIQPDILGEWMVYGRDNQGEPLTKYFKTKKLALEFSDKLKGKNSWEGMSE